MPSRTHEIHRTNSVVSTKYRRIIIKMYVDCILCVYEIIKVSRFGANCRDFCSLAGEIGNIQRASEFERTERVKD